ncbi:hypothetical protein Lal_00001125 [Lupinus albus]|nr:hypothetical protein Lal_00001125 [Lupinus albus]
MIDGEILNERPYTSFSLNWKRRLIKFSHKKVFKLYTFEKSMISIMRSRKKDEISKDFSIFVGLHQGVNNESYLFSLVLNVLTEHIQDMVPQCMSFVDDNFLIGDSREKLNNKLETW